MIKKTFLSIVCLMSFTELFAGPKKAHRAQDLIVTIQIGDQQTVFVAESTGTKVNKRWKSSTGQSGSGELSADNFNFLLSEFKNLPKVATLPANCQRTWIEVSAGNLDSNGKLAQAREVKKSCLIHRTKDSQKFTEFSQLVTLSL